MLASGACVGTLGRRQSTTRQRTSTESEEEPIPTETSVAAP